MTESTSSNQLTKWKRVLIGALLSAGFAGISLLILWLAHFTDPFLLFAWPYFYAGLLGFNSKDPSATWVTILIWFFLGAGLAYFVGDNKKAVKLWSLPFGLAFTLSLVIWFLINNLNGG